MEEPMFPDKDHPPEDADLARVLGRAKRHWDALSAHLSLAVPAAKPEWKHYGKKSGWVFVLRGKKRNLLYLIPHEKHFVASWAFSARAVEEASRADLPASILEIVRQAPEYPEGRAIRLAVKTAADVESAKRLLAIKLES